MGKLILYSSPECSRCATVKLMLNKHNVDYINIENKEEAIKKGIEFFPAFEIDNKIIDNYVSVLNWLRENNYYSF